jgi:hypothetical protein
MSESLAGFQKRLAGALRGEPCCPVDPDSAGFRFTLRVRRSWCRGRGLLAAQRLMRLLPAQEAERLLDEYVDHGGGLEPFLATERTRLLAFLAPRLPDPSHALDLCRVGQALARARRAASGFRPSRTDPWRSGRGALCRGPFASLVWLHGDPAALLHATEGAGLPPPGPPSHALLFAPGLPQHFRGATAAEVDLWTGLRVADAAPALLEELLAAGALAWADRPTSTRASCS